mmetsp:Transcript_75790/g.222238  ORF Transcript_75790/g.222238 Transcript_75790/m.222238 type:complete len:240 (+) Transcript_75790:67-786(+)
MAAVTNAPVQVVMPGNDLFNELPKILIKQEFAAMEMCGCEARNRYRISQPINDDQEGPNIFLYIDEDSACLERICCSVNRSLTLNVHHGATKDGPVVQAMHKPFHCQGCCFMRPRFEVFKGARGSEMIGRVEDPCRCCEMDQQVFDKEDKLLFTTQGGVCQAGMCCPCCFSVDFDIKKDGVKAATISKRPMTCCEMCQRTNRFLVDFDQITDPNEKRMVLAAAMLIDLEYFEQNKNNDN